MAEYHPVNPLKSPVAWVGGKRRLAPAICEQIDRIDHQAYIEVFMGMGGVFLARSRRPKAEVINDASRDVVTLFRVARHHPKPCWPRCGCLWSAGQTSAAPAPRRQKR